MYVVVDAVVEVVVEVDYINYYYLVVGDVVVDMVCTYTYTFAAVAVLLVTHHIYIYIYIYISMDM
jgi:hypothetical protein